MVEIAYVLNLVVCLICAVLLVRGWRHTRSRLLMWSFACFAALSINNALILVDVLVVPDIDLSVIRAASALVGFSTLLFGLIWES
jgi:hypothetical protein